MNDKKHAWRSARTWARERRGAFTNRPSAWMRWVAVAIGLVAAGGAGGCQIAGLFGALSGDLVRAEYRLEDRPTLVMVEDPDDALGETALAGVVARSVENHLRARKVLRHSPLIDQRELHQVVLELGDDYAQAPIDRIGRLVGAEQVIHVNVHSVRLLREMGVREPVVEVEVKIIDAEHSRRLFPEAASFDATGEPRPGRRIVTQMDPSAARELDQGSQSQLMRQISERAGRDVARLFYNWYRNERGERLPG